MQDTNSLDKNDALTLTKEAIQFLGKAANWSFIISIVGFFYIALIFIMAFVNIRLFASFVNPISGSSSGGLLAYPVYLYIIILTIICIPIFYLFRFSVITKKAIKETDTALLTEAFIKLNSYNKFIAILLLIVVLLQLIVGIPALFMTMRILG